MSPGGFGGYGRARRRRPAASDTVRVRLIRSGRTAVGKEGNRIQTIPGGGWFVLLRFCGPLELFFDKTWRPREIEVVR